MGNKGVGTRLRKGGGGSKEEGGARNHVLGVGFLEGGGRSKEEVLASLVASLIAFFHGLLHQHNAWSTTTAKISTSMLKPQAQTMQLGFRV